MADSVDILLYVALIEEADSVLEMLGDHFQPKELSDVALTSFCGTLSGPTPERDYKVAVVPAGKMGNTRSATMVSLLIEKLRPVDVVVIGIAGSLANDMEPGDVFIPDSVNEYLANSATHGEENCWTFSTSGNHFQTSVRLLNRFQLFAHTHKAHYQIWQDETRQLRTALIPDTTEAALATAGLQTRSTCKLYSGDDRRLASGPAVGKGKAFVEWITREVDRKVAAMEMESAGVYDAAIVRTPAPRTVAIRGISDYADSRKDKLEATAKGRFRALAAKNAVALFMRAVKAGIFVADATMPSGLTSDVSDRVFSETSKSWKAWAAYRECMIFKATANDWWLKPILITVNESNRPARSARDAILEWISNAEARHCVLLGDPGAGKTGLLTWTGSFITEQKSSIALWVSAKRLRSLKVINISSILAICDPSLPEDISQDSAEREVFFLLDGLDELTGAAEGGEAVAAALLREALDSIPVRWRVLASCRTPSFDALHEAFKETLARWYNAGKYGDEYNVAIVRALGLQQRSVTLIHVARLESNVAKAYLEDANLPRSVVEKIMDDRQWRQLLSSPFLLRLARLALPDLIKNGSPTLDCLYDTYTKAALYREDRGLGDAQLAAILGQLTQLSNFIDHGRSIRIPELALRASLLRERDGKINFTHYSLWEYFFARHLRSEILRASARTLAHVDLIAAYNVNRMLVPMLLRDVAEQFLSGRSIRIVTPSEYLEFVESTDWRRSTGYGLHPSRTTDKARVPASTFKFDPSEALAVHRDKRHGLGISPVACAVSWYDAVTFALWLGGRLPTSQELIDARPPGTHLLWCSDWHDEDISHITAYDMGTGTVQGLNPDVRLPRTALAIVESD